MGTSDLRRVDYGIASSSGVIFHVTGYWYNATQLNLSVINTGPVWNPETGKYVLTHTNTK